MILRWFINCLVNHPYIILLTISLLSGTCLILPFTVKSMYFPSFQDPQLGFSTRGTPISNRITAYTNLIKATRPSGLLTTNPQEFLFVRNKTINSNDLPPPHRKNQRRKKPKHSIVYGNVTNVLGPNTTEAYLLMDKWKTLQNLSGNSIRVLPSPIKNIEGFFCGNPDDRYAHYVVTPIKDEDLFSLSKVISLCHLERRFTQLKHFKNLCIQNTKSESKRCCIPWSLPNFIAALREKPSCLGITEDDVIYTKTLLLNCAQYFRNSDISVKCFRDIKFCDAPLECIRHDVVFNMMNYLVSSNYLSAVASNPTAPMTETLVFLPLAGSTAILPYFHEFERAIKEDYQGLKIAAVNFGIKNALFDEYLRRDAFLMVFGASFIFICIWIYTNSLFLTTMTITVIIYSLAVSYFMYFMVYNIKFFPFMNILTAVISLGIISDDAFIFCKVWSMQKHANSDKPLHELMTETFHHAVLSMLVTALTTAVAFLGSYISTVTAISCFSIFAGTTVIANYILMVTLFPACVIIWEQYSEKYSAAFRRILNCCFGRFSCEVFRLNYRWSCFQCIESLWKAKKLFFIDVVLNLRIVWLFALTLMGLTCTGMLLAEPLLVPNSTEFQLFSASHVFEQFDFIYKNKFWFNQKDSLDEMRDYRLPMRFVWGVLPVDNGDHLNPLDLGTLDLDPSFDISDKDAQVWLKEFCQRLRQQSFYHLTLGPLLPNCFIETFEKSMRRPCRDSFTGEDRTPCCEIAKFPFERSMFNKCAIEEVAELLETPAEYLVSTVAGPKFSKDQNPTIKALIVEFDSNYMFSLSYEELDKFYKKVESWTQTQLATAPATLKNGFFTSDLDFYDLQRELSRGTMNAVLVSMGLAFIVLFLSTLNVITSILAIVTILFSITVTIVIITLLGWKLNILESLAISTAIGLTVDFSLHYSVHYRLCPVEIAQNREAATKYAMQFMTGPSFMVALTTSAAGAFMTWSFILPYIQIGIFLIIVMCVSWVYATFFLCGYLATIGPEKSRCQYSYTSILRCLLSRYMTTDYITEASNSTITDRYELNALTISKQPEHPTPLPIRRSNTSRATSSPPHISGAIILADDN